MNFLQVFWLVIPIALIWAFPRIWLHFIRVRYLKKLKWILLEIKVPRDITKTPKAMEQIFTAVYSIYSYGLRPYEIWIEGVSEEKMSFEIVGHGGGVYFYLRAVASRRNLVEAAIYSQYPNAEIVETEDYVKELPPALPNQNYDIFGFEFMLGKPNPYPIRTYVYFETAQETALEEKRIDPISVITEVMANLKEDERIWLQFIIRPTPDDWKDDAEKIVNKLMGKKEVKKLTWVEEVFIFFLNFFKAPIEYPTWPTPPGEEERPMFLMLSSGTRAVIEAIENKASKLGFDSIIRFVYIDKKTSFSRANVGAVSGALHQFNTQNLNAIRPNTNTMTRISKKTGQILFRKRRLFLRKKRMFKFYRERRIPEKFSILNTEELATLYHFPISIVRAPTLERIEAKKGEPPMSLPVE